jgi:hypothetical protein
MPAMATKAGSHGTSHPTPRPFVRLRAPGPAPGPSAPEPGSPAAPWPSAPEPGSPAAPGRGRLPTLRPLVRLSAPRIGLKPNTKYPTEKAWRLGRAQPAKSEPHGVAPARTPKERTACSYEPPRAYTASHPRPVGKPGPWPLRTIVCRQATQRQPSATDA